MKKILFFQLAFVCLSVSAQKPSTVPFTEGIIYSRTSFPGHLLNDTIKTLDFENDDLRDQYHVIQALKKHQHSLKNETEQQIRDVYFISGMMILPAWSKMYFTPSQVLINTDALGYNQQLLLNKADASGMLVIADRDRTNQGTVHFKKEEFPEVWQKYKIDALQYTSQKTSETAVIAGYTCKKIIYNFGGTSHGSGVSNYIINLQPQKITVWYNEVLPSSLNTMLTHDFELDKAILKYEVEYDKQGKNKMLVEIIRIEPKKIDEETFDIRSKAPEVKHIKNGFESGSMIMQIMMNAISLLNK